VILPSRLHVAVVHRLLRQTSSCSGSRAQAMNLRLRIMPGSPAIRKLEDSFGASRFPPDHGIMAHPKEFCLGLAGGIVKFCSFRIARGTRRC
jgi:hypothetical protein